MITRRESNQTGDSQNKKELCSPHPQETIKISHLSQRQKTIHLGVCGAMETDESSNSNSRVKDEVN